MEYLPLPRGERRSFRLFVDGIDDLLGKIHRSLQYVLQRLGEHVRAEALGDEAHGAAIEACPDGGTVVGARNHHDGRLWGGLLEAGNSREAALVLQRKVEQA